MDIAATLRLAKSLDTKCFAALAGLWRELYLNTVCDKVMVYGDEKNSFGLVRLHRF